MNLCKRWKRLNFRRIQSARNWSRLNETATCYWNGYPLDRLRASGVKWTKERDRLKMNESMYLMHSHTACEPCQAVYIHYHYLYTRVIWYLESWSGRQRRTPNIVQRRTNISSSDIIFGTMLMTMKAKRCTKHVRRDFSRCENLPLR